MSARSKIVRDFSGQEVAIPYDPRDDAQHTPGPLRVIKRGPDHDAIITEAGGIVANVNRHRRETTVSSNAAELVRRWNTHGALLEALRSCLDLLEANESDDEWGREFAKPRADAARAAIAAAEGK